MEAQNRKRRILVAEDNPSDVILIQYALQQNEVDAEIIVFDNGEAASRFFDSGPVGGIDLMLLDFHLPRRNGPDLLRHLQANGMAGIPAIVMSSSSAKTDRQEAEDCGARYFVKPATLDEFMQLGAIAGLMLRKPEGGAQAGYSVPPRTENGTSGR